MVADATPTRRPAAPDMPGVAMTDIRHTVLCYGDSLTWGYDPAGPSRHRLEDRWPSVLAAGLGGRFHVIAEGLNGRTTAFDDHLSAADRNGARLLPTLLESHA